MAPYFSVNISPRDSFFFNYFSSKISSDIFNHSTFIIYDTPVLYKMNYELMNVMIKENRIFRAY